MAPSSRGFAIKLACNPFLAQTSNQHGGLMVTTGTPGSNATLMVSGPQHRVAAVVRILRTSDKPAAQESRQRQ